MTKTFQYMLKQIRPILIEIVENLDFEKRNVAKEDITKIIENYQDKETTIKGLVSQIINSYFISEKKEIYIHPLLEYFSESKKHQNEVLHYGLYRYVEPYFTIIEHLFNDFNKTSGIYKKRRAILEFKLINTLESSLKQASKLNNVSRALLNLEECKLIENRKDGRGNIEILIKEYQPDSKIFFFTLLNELKQKKIPGINQGDILKLDVVKVWFLKNRNLSNILNQLKNMNYISFGHLTGGTININKEKIEKWRSIYDF